MLLKYIRTEIFYSMPSLFSTDTVDIPKNINGFREYRFFSKMSHPSKNRKSSNKISRWDLYEFQNPIINVILKILFI